jgi:hypothetical protein
MAPNHKMMWIAHLSSSVAKVRVAVAVDVSRLGGSNLTLISCLIRVGARGAHVV